MFYKKNAFVYITITSAQGYWHGRQLTLYITQAIPVRSATMPIPGQEHMYKTLQNPPTALHIQAHAETSVDNTSGERSKPRFGAVITGAHLPALVQVLNGNFLTGSIVVDFRRTSKHYLENHERDRKLADSLKGLETWTVPREFGPTPTINVQNWAHSDTIPQCLSELGHFPPLRAEERMVEARRTRAYGDSFVEAGDAIAAISQYSVTLYTMIYPLRDN